MLCIMVVQSTTIISQREIMVCFKERDNTIIGLYCWHHLDLTVEDSAHTPGQQHAGMDDLRMASAQSNLLLNTNTSTTAVSNHSSDLTCTGK